MKQQRLFRVCVALSLMLAVLAAGLPAGAAPLAQQQQQDITMEVQGGFGSSGTYLLGEWLPVRVTLRNQASGPARRVKVDVSSKGSIDEHVAGIYAREVDLPPGAVKEVTLYASAGTFARSLDVRLLEGSTVLQTKKVSLDPKEPPTNLIVGVVSGDSSLLNVLQSQPIGRLSPVMQAPSSYSSYAPSTGVTNISASVVHVDLAQIPPLSAALNSLGVLVLDDTSSAGLSGEQSSAMASWVARGGSLVVVGRPGGIGGLGELEEMLPVEIAGSRNLAGLTGLSDLVMVPITVTTPVVVADATLKEGPPGAPRVIASEGGVPLVAQRKIGRGQVVYLALSPGVAPLKGWDGLVPLMQRALAEHSVGTSFGATRRYSNSYSFYGGTVFDNWSNSLFALPGLDLPDTGLLGLFLLIYIISIGPVNFIILRRLRRAELAWVTIPALVLIFSVLSYVMAYQAKGGEVVTLRADIGHAVAGLDTSEAVRFFGLFSPSRRTYSLEVSGQNAVTEVDGYQYSSSGKPAEVTGGENTIINNVAVDTWSINSFMAEGTVEDGSPLTVDLRLGDNVIEGTLRNTGNEALQDVALIRGDAVQYFGSMGPGASVSVKLAVSPRAFNNDSPRALLPPPAGVTAPTSNQFYGSGSDLSDDEREYYRRIEALGMALYPLLADEPPGDFDVVSVAWGAPVEGGFNIRGGVTASNSELDIWTGRHSVRDASEQAGMREGLTPLTIYLPAGQTRGLYSRLIATDELYLDPYADLIFRVPAGTQPEQLVFNYTLATLDAPVDVLAYNAPAGRWDKVGILDGENTRQRKSLEVPDPAAHTGPGGDIILRLHSPGGAESLLFDDVDLLVNRTPGEN